MLHGKKLFNKQINFNKGWKNEKTVESQIKEVVYQGLLYLI